MTESFHRACKCGAIHRRTESMADGREIDLFQCDICGEILESWTNTAWVPHWRLIAGPVRPPETPKRTRAATRRKIETGLAQARQRPLGRHSMPLPRLRASGFCAGGRSRLGLQARDHADVDRIGFGRCKRARPAIHSG
jgi:hypothetical protein